jgi:hypothetical protein
LRELRATGRIRRASGKKVIDHIANKYDMNSTKNKMACYCCGKYGHLARDCWWSTPNSKGKGGKSNGKGKFKNYERHGDEGNSESNRHGGKGRVANSSWADPGKKSKGKGKGKLVYGDFDLRSLWDDIIRSKGKGKSKQKFVEDPDCPGLFMEVLEFSRSEPRAPTGRAVPEPREPYVLLGGLEVFEDCSEFSRPFGGPRASSSQAAPEPREHRTLTHDEEQWQDDTDEQCSNEDMCEHIDDDVWDYRPEVIDGYVVDFPKRSEEQEKQCDEDLGMRSMTRYEHAGVEYYSMEDQEDSGSDHGIQFEQEKQFDLAEDGEEISDDLYARYEVRDLYNKQSWTEVDVQCEEGLSEPLSGFTRQGTSP